jgi:hypothetical protein
MNRRYRITVVEEVQRHNRPMQYMARADLGGTVEADDPSDAKKVALEGMKRDRRFQGMTIVSVAFRDRSTLHVIARSVHLSSTYQMPGGVYRAPGAAKAR